MTFALQPEPRDGAKQSKRERSSVREKAQEFEKMVCKENEEGATRKDGEEWEQLSSSVSSKEESEDGEVAKVDGSSLESEH